MKITLNIILGIIAGIINCIVWYSVASSLNYYSFDVDRYRYYTTLLLLLGGIFISIYYQRKSNGGFIDFKAALKCGVLFTLTLALILGIFNYLYYKYITPDSVDFFLSEAKNSMISQKVSDADIPKHLESVKSYFGTFRMFMSTMILGVIISLIAGAIFRKKDPTATFSAN